MGRHSAPDDVDDGAAGGGLDETAAFAAAVSADQRRRRGRHAVADEPDDANDADGLTGPVEPSVVTVLAPLVETAATEQPSAPEQPQRAGRSTASDFALVRRHADVRARVIAAIVVPFVAFTIVMAVLGRLDVSYLTWIWIPLISAGVLVGLFLDLGHKRYPSGTDQPV